MNHKIFIGVFFVLASFGCKKELNDVVNSNQMQVRRQDSVFKKIQEVWSLEMPEISFKKHQELLQWKQWKEYSKIVKQPEKKSVKGYLNKVHSMLRSLEWMIEQIPENLKQKPIESRLLLLRTNIQNLEMILELNTIEVKEVQTLINKINKNTLSIVNQVEKINIRKEIPKEKGEDALLQGFDTLKRATSKAIPVLE